MSDNLIGELKKKNILLIEDVCESHGAMHNSKKLGSIGWMSNFSFYYAHHMSTIEGGMICTDDFQVYNQLLMLRSHGMVREIKDDNVREKIISKNNSLNPEFIFQFPSYNVRNNEIGAIIGNSQLIRLDENVKKRNENLMIFLSKINDKKYKTDFYLDGCSNYAFNLILQEPDDIFVNKLMNKMKNNGIEFRRGSAGGGNQVRQPYLKNFVTENHWLDFPNTEHVHFYGFYIGNFPDLKKDEIDTICSTLNNV